ncbi:MFS transporter [Vibrio ezurae]|uniref:Putative major facilitator superfamily transporter n=1 Tax=Vibrio ezurae NBRC 102218 TaxID=1219080 RepID=U3B2A2_9VIBR|nr:MFS transporter [Vibrio ezurae]GAD79572.1 putative major facilitator superfamily transporter [Vibrio ezurae NBRC 102218]
MTLSRKHTLAFIGILLLASNLRGPFTSLAPLLDQIMTQLHLSSTILGMLSSLPLLSFAIISPIALVVLKHLGLKNSICTALLSIFLGVCLRSYGDVYGLYMGTVFIGAGIAVGNVLLPVAVKVSFPARIAVVTSLYTFTMGIGSAVSSTVMVPLSHVTFSSELLSSMSGWQLALLFNLVFVSIALIFWLFSPQDENKPTSHQSVNILQLMRSPVAWQVTLALGLNSFTFYSFAAWLPKILIDHGMSETQSGYIYGLLQFATMLPGLVLIPLLTLFKNSRWLYIATSTGVVVAALGTLYFPQWAVLWTLMFGFSNCATFVIGLSFIGLRTHNAPQAAALSAMSQSIGYGIATLGPPLLGFLYQANGNWSFSLWLVALMGCGCVYFGTLSCRETKVN